MKQTLENWYSQNQLTPQQYYQLVDLVNPNTEYQLPELVLLASLPTTAILPDPNNELSKFQTQRDLWDYENSLSDWLDEPIPSCFLSKELLFTIFLLTLALIILTLPKNHV